MEKRAICAILAYNCAGVLEDTFRRIPTDAVERIILVDDASTDNTLEVARRLGIESYTHPHTGYGGNVKYLIRKGLELGAEYVVDLHGDGQYDPAVIPTALAKAREGYDLVLGSRFTEAGQPLKDGMSWARYLANIGLSTIQRVVLGLPLTEFHTGFRVYSRHLAEVVSFDHSSNNHLFSFQIIVQAHYAGLKVGEVPIRCDYSGEHTSISIRNSTIYAFQTFGTLALYVLAKMGFKVKLFASK
ncbi:MAG TPA: glycosyltransferase family 2 protein [Candidatus Paceibacterota bacterium]